MEFIQIPSVLFVLTILVTIGLALMAQRFFERLIKLSTEHMRNDPTNYKFLKHTVVAIIYLIGFGIAVYQVPELRTIAKSMLAGAGILAVAVGFAAQHALSNVISGVFIIIFKPFRVNDRLSVKGMEGIVEDITLRHTVIRDFENRHILIPNTVISDEVIINSDYEDDRICKRIDIGISYESDLDLAKKIMAEEVEKHPLAVDPRTAEDIAEGAPMVMVRVLRLAEYSVNLRAWAWTKNTADGFILGCDLNESIKKRFDAAGIEIPYPHHTLTYKK